MRLPRFRLRTLMVAVAIVGGFCGWAVHARSLLRGDDEFGVAILVFEGVLASLIGGSSLAFFAFVMRVAREDAELEAHLRRSELPTACPWPPAGKE